MLSSLSYATACSWCLPPTNSPQKKVKLAAVLALIFRPSAYNSTLVTEPPGVGSVAVVVSVTFAGHGQATVFGAVRVTAGGPVFGRVILTTPRSVPPLLSWIM